MNKRLRVVAIPWKCVDPDCRHPEAPHKAHGLCVNCYQRRQMRKRYKEQKDKVSTANT